MTKHRLIDRLTKPSAKVRQSRRAGKLRLPCESRVLESLEPRVVLHGTGLSALVDRYMSLSFANDGTDIAGQPSALFATLDQSFSRDEWQTTVLAAFQTWASQISTDLGQMSEIGHYAFGTAGPSTGDERFGDIRVGARPLADNAMAISVSQNATVAGTWAADVIFNSQADFNSLDDLFSVALHEAGHVFGLEHSDQESSVMHIHGASAVSELSDTDIAIAQSLHGTRTPDAWEGASGNDLMSTAQQIEPVESAEDADGSGPAVAIGEITKPDDIDYYKIEMLGDYSGPITFRLRTTGVSLLAPDFTIFNADGDVLKNFSASTPIQEEIVFTLAQTDEEEQFFVRVQSSATDSFAIGGYSLAVTFDDLLLVSEGVIDSFTRTRLRNPDSDTIDAMLSANPKSLNDDQNADDEADNAFELEALVEFEEATIYTAVGSISSRDDIDFYKWSTPDRPAENLIANISVQSLNQGALVPRVTLLDEDRNAIDSKLLVNGGGELLIESTMSSDKEYFVSIEGPKDSLFDVGDYQVTISFSAVGNRVTSFAEGTVGGETEQDVKQLFVATPQLIHFGLHVPGAESPERGVLLRILDASGNVLHQLAARAGETRTAGSVLLSPGTYLSQAIAIRLPGSGENNIQTDYELSGAVVSDPFAVDPEVPSDAEFSCPDVDGMFCYPGGVISEDPFIWLDFIDSLPEIPSLEGEELQSVLLGDWWSWYWQVAGENAPPLPSDDNYQVDAGQRLTVSASAGLLSNDIDPDSVAVTAVLISGPHHGSLTLAPDGGFVYQPEPGFAGEDTFSYQAFDFKDTSTTARSFISVVSTNPILGDFTNDGRVTDEDIDMLAFALRTDRTSEFDVDGSGTTDDADWQFMITNVVGTTFGDSNLDGVFNSGDFVQVFQRGQYEDLIEGNSGWAAGDWNADGEFDTSDLVFAFQIGGYSAAATAQLNRQTVPIAAREPSIHMARRLATRQSDEERMRGIRSL